MGNRSRFRFRFPRRCDADRRIEKAWEERAGDPPALSGLTACLQVGRTPRGLFPARVEIPALASSLPFAQA
jgi:hypothetical protein